MTSTGKRNGLLRQKYLYSNFGMLIYSNRPNQPRKGQSMKRENLFDRDLKYYQETSRRRKILDGAPKNQKNPYLDKMSDKNKM